MLNYFSFLDLYPPILTHIQSNPPLSADTKLSFKSGPFIYHYSVHLKWISNLWQTGKWSAALSCLVPFLLCLAWSQECGGTMLSSSMSTAAPAVSLLSSELHSGAWMVSSSTASSASSFCTVSSTRWRQMCRDTCGREQKINYKQETEVVYFFLQYYSEWMDIYWGNTG